MLGLLEAFISLVAVRPQGQVLRDMPSLCRKVEGCGFGQRQLGLGFWGFGFRVHGVGVWGTV